MSIDFKNIMGDKSLLNNYALLLIAVFILSCKEEMKTLAAEEILSYSIESSGGEDFMNSSISFNIDDFNYQIIRQGNIQDFQVVRQVDTIQYKAIYKNGYSAYFINDINQEEIAHSRKFIETRLEGETYIFSIPHVFKQNATIVSKMEDVYIDQKKYYSLHITFKVIEDDPEDEFYLYIDQETFLVDYYAYKFDLTGNRRLFKKAINRKNIEGIAFTDYWAFSSPVDSTALKDLYKLYNIKSLQGLAKIEYQNIAVKLLKNE